MNDDNVTHPTQDTESKRSSLDRRSFIKGIGGAVALSAGFPSILKAREKDEVKIGFLTALTGLETILGVTQLNCFKMAVDEINQQGGIDGRKLVYVVEDDQTSTQGTINKARKLVYQDRVDSIIGMISSLEAVAARSVTIPAKKILMYTTYYEGGVCNRYFVSTGQIPNQQIDPTVPWLTENVGKSVYIIGSDYVWPRESAVAIQTAFEKQGGKVLSTKFFPFGTLDFGPVFDDIRAKKPDMVWSMVAGADAVTMLKQYRSFGMKPQLVGNGWDDVYSHFHPELIKGVIGNQAYFMSIQTPENKKFVKNYQARYGEDKPINAIGEAAYDATWLYAKAVAKAGSTDDERVIEALPKVSFNAPQGHVRISGENNVMVSNSILARGAGKMWDITENFGQIPPVVPGCKLRQS